ncbi:MAG: Acetyl-CoA synthetase [Stygiobacter sp.]|nr:MAG: Acetyl-CoA synthetase [Stygiobacter sp.]
MHRAQTGAGQHGDHRFRDHGHVDENAITLAHAQTAQQAGELGHLILQLGIGDGTNGVGDRAVIDDGGLSAATIFDVAIDGVVAGVDLATGEPAIERLARIIQNLVPGLVPVNILGGISPESLGIL